MLRDPHAWATLGVAGTACAFSFGLVYLAYFAYVLRIAARAPSRPASEGCVLVFGKHAPDGRIDPDFQARLLRAAELWRLQPARPLVLLGGRFDEGESEAELARRGLIEAGVADDATFLLESESRDTLQNLRNLGLDAELCAAEADWQWHPVALWRVAGEAAYVCWTDLGTRWARLIGHRGMLERIS